MARRKLEKAVERGTHGDPVISPDLTLYSTADLRQMAEAMRARLRELPTRQRRRT